VGGAKIGPQALQVKKIATVGAYAWMPATSSKAGQFQKYA